jgi:hypothetical protein
MSTMSREHDGWVTTLAAAFAVLALALAAAAAPAQAKPLERGHFEDTFDEVEDDFCGDMTVRIEGRVTGRFLVTTRGSSPFPYVADNLRETFVATNLATGKSYSRHATVTIRDMRITDNGDGTLTILVMGAGNETWHGPDGRVLFRNPGRSLWEILIDYGGTPLDLSDDKFLEFLGEVRPSTGRNDTEGRDFCEDFRAITG